LSLDESVSPVGGQEDGLVLLEALGGPDGPSGVMRNQRNPVGVQQDVAVDLRRTRNATVPARLGLSWLGTASASGRLVQRIRWMPTARPSRAVSASRPLAAFWAARAAGAAPSSRPVSSASSSTPRRCGATATGQSRVRRPCPAHPRSTALAVAGRPRRGSTRAPSTPGLRVRSLPYGARGGHSQFGFIGTRHWGFAGPSWQ